MRSEEMRNEQNILLFSLFIFHLVNKPVWVYITLRKERTLRNE
jgi:hypothetical protein